MKKSLIRIILVAMFTALISAGAFIRIPLPPVPVTLQTLFVILASLCLPPMLSLEAVCLYLFLGIIGLPVFTTGGGIAAIAGPTGGYLIGLLPAVLIGGLLSKVKTGVPWYLFCALIATVGVYVPGLLVLKYTRDLSWAATISAGLLPFIIGDTLKIIVSAVTAVAVRPKVKALLENNGQ